MFLVNFGRFVWKICCLFGKFLSATLRENIAVQLQLLLQFSTTIDGEIPIVMIASWLLLSEKSSNFIICFEYLLPFGKKIYFVGSGFDSFCVWRGFKFAKFSIFFPFFAVFWFMMAVANCFFSDWFFCFGGLRWIHPVLTSRNRGPICLLVLSVLLPRWYDLTKQGSYTLASIRFFPDMLWAFRLIR